MENQPNPTEGAQVTTPDFNTQPPVTDTPPVSAPPHQTEGVSDTGVTPAFQKVMKEKKNAMERLRQLETENQAMKEQALKEKEDWKTLAEQKQAALDAMTERHKAQEMKIEQAHKVSALRNELLKLGCQEQYLDAAMKSANINNVSFDSDTGQVSGAVEVASMVQQSLPPLFGTTGPRTDNSAPQGNPQEVSVESWKQMSPEDKQKNKAALYQSLGVTVRR